MDKLILDEKWTLKAVAVKPNDSVKDGDTFQMDMPGEVHGTLLDLGLMKDPYFGTNERDVQWVGSSDWEISRSFTWKKKEGHALLPLTRVDTIAELYINGVPVGKMENEHRLHLFDITDCLKDGENEIRFLFPACEKTAIERAEKLPYPVPCSYYDIFSPNRNLVRKTQCQAGWDWGLCLMTVGIYDPIEIIDTDDIYMKTSSIMPRLTDGRWMVDAEMDIVSWATGTFPLELTIDGRKYVNNVDIAPGEQIIRTSFEIEQEGIELWWPAGQGAQKLYAASLSLLSQKAEKRIAFRTVETSNAFTMGGKELTVKVNGRGIFMKGANWIPQDAMPSRITRERYDELLADMVDANMNMVRLWGGGRYEFDAFYELCDEKGIMIWHDMMFACATYPANKEFLDTVEEEIRYQIRRLKDHPSIALWCGNNEDLGAIMWYEESRKEPLKYAVDYDRLNMGTIGRVIKEEDPSRIFWPSSPCAGPDDYSDNWHNDGNGDMHFWAVWHEGKEFEHYLTVKPRFCSEFGYQSFPSLSGAKSFADPNDMNLTSPTFEHHQKNDAGNGIIIENFARYFRFPSSFENMLYLSQAQQTWAIDTAVTWWRSLMPYCMGTLYWQLNDVWPVCSWSSIEYSGKWKLLMYASKRFYAPLTVLLNRKDGKLLVTVANDMHDEKEWKLVLETVGYDGTVRNTETFTGSTESMTTSTVLERELSEYDGKDTFVRAVITSGDMREERFTFLEKPKKTEMEDPGLVYDMKRISDREAEITLKAEKPAFWIALDQGDIAGRFSDNMITMLPRERKVIFRAKEKLDMKELEEKLTVSDLFTATR